VIIDFHCHAGKGDKMTAPWNTDAPLGTYLRRARAAGIDKTIVIAPLHGNYQVANAQVARIVARYPQRLIGFTFVHTRRDAGRIFPMVKDAAVRWGFRGIKVHGFEAMPTREVCETARAFRLPILVDIVSRPEVVDMFAAQYPDVNFIIAHLGSFTDDWKAHQQVAYQLARYPNVYADTSGVRQFDYIVEAIKRAGPHKVLFGSDGPWLHPGLELHKIRLLGLPREQEELILGGNALRLLRASRTGHDAWRTKNHEAKLGNSEAAPYEHGGPLAVQEEPEGSGMEYKL
jgi:predicted TIM-barrel fold metal-dependent hydrolase